MRKCITICAITGICSIVALLPAATTALAQAGSTGGTIGKTGKSVSGDEEQTNQSPKRRRMDSNTGARTKTSSCRRIVGTWSWPLGATVSFKEDGSSSRTFFGTVGTGRWVCSEDLVVITWKGIVDHITISEDGNALFVSNSNGQTFTATRK
jgi:hypothetical protein